MGEGEAVLRQWSHFHLCISFRLYFFLTLTHIALFPLYYSAMQYDLIATRGSLLWSVFRLSEAFDAVNYGILLSKLYHYGVCGTPLKWFKKYLHDRTQFVTSCVNVCRILKKRESIFISRPQKIRFFTFIGPRGQGNKLIINRYRATTILA